MEATRPLGHGPELSGSFAVNCVADGQLTFTQIPSLASMSPSAQQSISTSALLGFANDAGVFPSVAADFALDWQFGTALPGGYTNPTVALNDITLVLGSFLTDTLGRSSGRFKTFSRRYSRSSTS